MNSVQLLGYLTKDPECRYTQSQKAMCTFTLAVNRGKDRDGNDKGADFIRIVVWDRQAETCEKYLSKGRQVAIEGRIQTGSYTKDDGTKVYTTDVVASRVHFINDGTKAAPKSSEGPTEASQRQPMVEVARDSFAAIQEEVPF